MGQCQNGICSAVHKIPDIKQMENETVIQYFSKALKTMEEVLPQETRDALHIHKRTHVAAGTLNHVSILLITAGLIPIIRMEILKRDNLTLA